MKIFKLFYTIIFILSFFLKFSFANEYNLEDLKNDFIEMNSNFKIQIDDLPEAVDELEKDFDEAIDTLYLSMQTLTFNDVNFDNIAIIDQLNIFENLISNVSSSLPKEISHNMDELDMNEFSEQETELLTITMADLKKVKLNNSVLISESINRVNETSFNINNTLEKFEEIDERFAILDFDKFKQNMATDLNVDVDTLMDSAENKTIIPQKNDSEISVNNSISLNNSMGLDDLNDTTKKLTETTNEVSQVTEEVSQVTEEVSQVTEEVSQVTEEVSQVTEEVSQVTEEVTEIAQEVSQVTQEVSQIVEDVSDVTENLNQVVEEISEATSEIAEATSTLSEEASNLANWISSGKFDMSLATNFADHVDWDSWDPGRWHRDTYQPSQFYKKVHQSTDLLEALAEVNDAINCNDGTCVFDDWKDVRDLEDYEKIMSYCDNKPENTFGGFAVNGVNYSYSDCP